MFDLIKERFNMEIKTNRLILRPLNKKDIESSLKNLGLFYKTNNLISKEKRLSQLMEKIYNIKLINNIQIKHPTKYF